MSRIVFLVGSLIATTLLAFGCADQNSSSALPGEVHPAGWGRTHATQATQAQELRGCQGCHGFDFVGGSSGVSCFNCHDSGPPFVIHPAGWLNVIQDHQAFALTISWTTCSTAACHGSTLTGGSAGPSCFNLSVSCHASTGGDPGAPHPASFANPTAHGPLAKANQFFCRNCHGRPQSDFNGGFVADLPGVAPINANGACSLCHPAAKAHPTNWQGSNDPDPSYAASHRGVDQTAQTTGCSLCHLTTGPGTGPVTLAPSCFSAGHTSADGSTTACHANGPLAAPHPVDGSYRAPAAHGKAAKQDLTACQACHATPNNSGPGSNPRFNAAIGSLANGCETCHPAFHAHPEVWAGPNPGNVFHYSAGNINTACTLCHGANLDGVGGAGISCLNCHAEMTLFTLDCTACHGFPPTGVASSDPDVSALGGNSVNHRNVAGISAHDQCATCHGVKNSGTGTSGSFTPNANYRTFDPITATIGDHWNGQVNMNGPTGTGTGYNQTNFGCDNAACHGNDAAHQLADSNLSVAFGDYGAGSGGGSAPHALDGTFLAPANHGASAKADLANCKTCHGQDTTINPRYNQGIVSQGSNGCEGCHNDFTAHPSVGARDNVHWYDGTYRHSTGTRSVYANACGMCHPGLGGSGTVGPACTFCHVSNPLLATVGCSSCHGAPPNGTTKPNRRGQHNRSAHSVACSTCHTSDGPGSITHFTKPTTANNYVPADLRTAPNIGNTNMTINQVRGANNSSTTTCTGQCHGTGTNHNETW